MEQQTRRIGPLAFPFPAAADQVIALARLSGLEGFSRSVVTGVVPVVALDALGGKAAVSYVYLVGAFLTLGVSLNLGTFERHLPRRWLLTSAICCTLTASAVFAFVDGSLIAIAIALMSVAASVFSVCVSLFVMDVVAKQDLARNESRRIGYHGVAWLVGPSLGLWAWERVGHVVPFALSAGTALLVLSYFRSLQLAPADKARTVPTTNPLRTVPRYFSQRRLRVAYAITTTRSIFWFAVFVYGPIYVIEAGLPAWVGGALLSFVSSLLLFSHVVNRVAGNRGVRWIVLCSFGTIAAGALLLALIGDARPIGLLAWVLAAVGGAALDVVGNIPFMRLVRPRERVPMTGVFSTWREVSSLLAPALAALSLALGSFRIFDVLLAALSLATALAATSLPRRL